MSTRRQLGIAMFSSAIFVGVCARTEAQAAKSAPADTPPTVSFPPPAPPAVPAPPSAPLAPTAAAEVSLPAAANPDYIQAVTAAVSANRNDAELKAAELEVDHARAALKSDSHDIASQQLVEEAQLKLELLLAKKGRVLRASAQGIVDVRTRQIEARLAQITAAKKASKETGGANGAPVPSINSSK